MNHLATALIFLLVAAFALPRVETVCAQTVAGNPKPNIIFVMADDLGWGDLGCYGQRRIRTPYLDRMAAEGTLFTQVYSGATVCAPSRSVLMTGQHGGHTRIRGNARHPLRPEDVTVAEVLKGAGYRTGLIGKWGLGEAGSTGVPNRQGFDYFYGYLNQHHAHNYYPTFLWRNEEKVQLRNTVPNEDQQGGGMAEKRVEYSHDLFMNEAQRFIRDNRNNPFFLYLALTIPHANNEAREKGMEVPDLGEYANTDWPAGVKGHAAMITRMDRDMGRLFDLLKELGLDQNTIVFFTSDNGPHKESGYDPSFNDSNGPLRGIKRDHYEGGIRVPMLVRWPGRVPAGARNGAVWYFPDVLPTLAALAGAEAPPQIDGVNVLPSLLGRKQRELEQRFLYWEFHERGFFQASRRGKWKAVRLGPGQPLELYDVENDPGETQNLAHEQPQVAARFETFFRTARTESPEWPVKMPETK